MPESTPPPPPPAPFTHREIVVIMTGLMLGMSLAVIDMTILGAALSKISDDLSAGDNISWIVSIYLLVSTAATPIYGKLSDLYGRKIMLQSAIAIFIVASTLCALAGSLSSLIALRALQGLGGGGLLVMAQITLADITTPRERGRYQIFPATVWLVGGMLGPVLGGVFADHLTWRWIFWINIPLGLAALVMTQITLRRLPIRRSRSHHIDYLGAVLLVAAISTTLMIATLGGTELAWSSPWMFALIAAAAILFGLVALQERSAREPLLPPRLFANRTFIVANMAVALSMGPIIGAITLIPVLLQMAFAISASDSGFMLLPFAATGPLCAIISARVMTATGRYKQLCMIGITLSGVAMLLLAFTNQTTPLWVIAAMLAAFGVGGGLSGPALMVGIQNALGAEDIGTGTAALAIFRNIGGALGTAVFSTLVIGHIDQLATALPGLEHLGPRPAIALLHAGGEALDRVPAALRAPVGEAINSALRLMYWIAAAIDFLIVALLAFMPHIPLRAFHHAPGAARK